nr:immunoglobulin heavy chain junction region [Mus musculus]
CANSFDYW